MPTYEFKCLSCELYYEIIIRLKDYDDCEPKCGECGSKLSRYFGTPPNFKIPANCTYDGKVRIGGGNNRKELQVPINIVDEKPDGTYKVTRIGKKSDIENE